MPEVDFWGYCCGFQSPRAPRDWVRCGGDPGKASGPYELREAELSHSWFGGEKEAPSDLR